MYWHQYGCCALALLWSSGLGAERLYPKWRTLVIHDYQSRLPISPTLSDELVGILRQLKPRGRSSQDYWLFDAYGHPMIALDLSRFPLPRDGLGSLLGRRVRLRGERMESLSMLRVAFIQREEDEIPSVPNKSRPLGACKPPSPTSPSGH
ncbi:MAG: hypothetical protein LBT57_02120 [Puniceicoccales bacterium]|jgi:hypothetical protein|nr:hypothetical protein [Puniceicoccales bacterium]